MLYVGMDIHKRFSQVAVLDESGEVLGQRRLDHIPAEELRRYFNEFPKDTQVIMEPTCGKRKLKGRPSTMTRSNLVWNNRLKMRGRSRRWQFDFAHCPEPVEGRDDLRLDNKPLSVHCPLSTAFGVMW